MPQDIYGDTFVLCPNKFVADCGDFYGDIDSWYVLEINVKNSKCGKLLDVYGYIDRKLYGCYLLHDDKYFIKLDCFPPFLPRSYSIDVNNRMLELEFSKDLRNRNIELFLVFEKGITNLKFTTLSSCSKK